MATRHHNIHIAAPPEAVFEAVADVDSHHRWQHGLLRSEHEPNVRRVGGKGAEVRILFGRELRFP